MVGALAGGTVGATQDGAWTVAVSTVTTLPGVFAEDGAHASGESGYLVLAVRNDTPTALANTTLDRIPLTWLIPRPHVV